VAAFDSRHLVLLATPRIMCLAGRHNGEPDGSGV